MLKNLLACLLISALSVVSTTAIASKASHTNAHHMKTTAVSAEAKQSAKALAFIIAVDKNEIALAKLAKLKTENKDVLDFANMMIMQHAENLKAAEKLSHDLHLKIAKNAAATVKKEGKQAVHAMKKLKGRDFEKQYMAAMVNGHQKVLNALNHTYLKDTQDAKVKDFLTDTSTKVEQHLSAARKVQEDLSKA